MDPVVTMSAGAPQVPPDGSAPGSGNGSAAGPGNGSAAEPDNVKACAVPGHGIARRVVIETGAVFSETVGRFVRHRGDTLSAALAFQTLLALAPLLVVAVAVLAFAVGEGNARTEALGTVRKALGWKGAELVESWLDAARSMGTWATAIGTGLFLLGADRLVGELHVVIDVVFERPTEALRHFRHHAKDFLRQRLRGLIMTLGLGLWIAVSLLARFAMTAVWPEGGQGWSMVVQLLTISASLVGALAVLYRMLPVQKLAWRDVWIGAAVTALLQIVVSWLLELWITRSNVGAGYGATGAIIAILLWLYVSSLVFVFGAELSAVLLHRRWLRAGRRLLRIEDACPTCSPPPPR